MPSTSNVDDNLTWAVRPNSQLTEEGLTDLFEFPGVRRRNQQAPSLSGLQSKEYHSGDTGGDSDTLQPKRKQRSNTVSSVGYKPNLTKPTFQWMRGELLGKGSYGQVFLALNATTGELMAVKQVELPKTASDKANTHQLNVLKALKFESDTLKDLDHHNIVQYLGFEESQDHLSIFLEYVPGGSVSALLQAHGRLREEIVTSFLYQILDGLEYLHSKNIIHRDLKADNILVEPTGVCKISDFGISKKASDLHQGGRAHTMMRGTVFWMAPEVVASNGGQGYDLKVDIWSMGCIALEMWSGRRPWNDLPMMPVMFKLFTEKSPPPVPDDIELSPLADAFRLECFHVEPQKRPHAHVLKKHAYLHQYKATEWIFDMKDLAYSDKPPQPWPIQYSSPSQTDQRRSAKDRPSREEATTIVPSRAAPRPPAAKPSLAALTIPEYKPAHSSPKREASRKGSQSDRSRRTALSPLRKQESEGPRVVYITPPGSPKSKASDDAWGLATYGLSSASESQFSSRKGKSRRYIVSNPDAESQTPSFVYTPPPLPDINRTPSASSPSFKSLRQFEAETLARSTSSFMAPGMSPPPLSSVPSSISSAGSEPSPSPILSASTSLLRSPRPLPPSPAAPIPMPSTSLSFKSAYPPSRYQQSTPSLPLSSSRHEDRRSTAYRSAHPQDNATTTIVNGKPIRRLPVISPPRTLKTSSSAAHLPSSGSRSLTKQKSVPDVSIFAFDRPNTAHGSTSGTHNIRSFSLDTDSGHPSVTRRPSTASNVTPTRALPDPMKLAAQRNAKINEEESTQKQDNRLTLRPRAEDVYEHLESWFPNHNLDQAIDDGTVTPTAMSPQTNEAPATRERKTDNRKSIKMIAKERVSNRADPWSHARRQTRLWNSNVKELKG